VKTSFDEYANSIGLDLERFKKDMEGAEVKARIEADRRRGAALGIDRTPAIFVNNHRVPSSALSPIGLRAAVEAGLGGEKIKEQTKEQH
jgi:predicted DsbA family dithiol-disulfide isomerase